MKIKVCVCTLGNTINDSFKDFFSYGTEGSWNFALADDKETASRLRKVGGEKQVCR